MQEHPFGQRMVNTLASAECELSADHITGHAVETSGCGHAMFGFRSARGGAYWQTKAFQTSRLSPNSHLVPNKTTTCGSICRTKSVNGEVYASRSP